ncbi:MAG: hypothetical protein JW814_01580 [Candidatus Krumholzibacteriota bacterium]|nr:hypothetical protein [Candidatus Krumholzibacteriota bacterium]
MIKKKPRQKAVALSVFAIITILGGLLAWRLSDIPFGTLFDTVLLVTAVGAASLIGTVSLIMFRSKIRCIQIAGAIPGIFAVAMILLIIIIKIDYKIIPGTSYRTGLSSEEWIGDLKYFTEKFPELHPRLFEMIEREDFKSQALVLEEKIPAIGENSIKTEFYKLLALPGDAHSFPNIFTHKIDWHLLPFSLWLFDSGLMITDAGRDHREMIGAYIVKIDDTDIDLIYEKLRSCMAAENEHGWKLRFTYAISVSEWLESEGIVKDRQRVTLTLETVDGSRFKREIRPVHFLPVIYWSSLRKIDNRSSFVYSNDCEDNFWFEYVEDTGTLYLQFNACQRESRIENIDQFVSRLGDWIDNNDFDRMVIDIRKNDGGDSYVSRAIAGMIIGKDKVDRSGRLFALSSRKTFSAAVMFLSLLEYNTRVVIVGEETGQGPFFCGRPRTLVLPNSRMELLIGSYYNRCALVDDGENAIVPDIAVPYTADDFLCGRDPAIEAVLSYIPERREIAPVKKEDLRAMAGRYMYSPFQILEVESVEGRLQFAISDFFEGSYGNARSELYPEGDGIFATDIRGVELVYVNGTKMAAGKNPGVAEVSSSEETREGILLRWRGVESFAPRVKKGQKLPMELIAEGRVEDGVRELFEQRDLYLAEVPDLESRLNGTGYALLRKDDFKPAIEIFRLNLKLFPASANVYDSLAEGYLLAGEVETAKENYRKSLEIDPGNKNAREILRLLEKGKRYDRASGKWVG